MPEEVLISTVSPHTAGLPAGSLLLALNVTAAKPRHLLALVDAARARELSEFNWKTSPNGAVFRSWYSKFDPGHQSYESLARRVVVGANSPELASSRTALTDDSPSVPIYLNGDSLDCRVCNVWPMCRSDDPAVRVPAGSTFRETDAWGQSAADCIANKNALKGLFPPYHRTPILSNNQVEELLQAFSTLPAYWNKQYSFLLQELVPEGVKYSAPQLRAVLRGEQQRVAGFGYEKILPLLPKRGRQRHTYS